MCAARGADTVKKETDDKCKHGLFSGTRHRDGSRHDGETECVCETEVSGDKLYEEPGGEVVDLTWFLEVRLSGKCTVSFSKFQSFSSHTFP